MTSFGCREDRIPGWQPTFRVKGQIHHRIGSLLNEGNERPVYCQIYFIEDAQEQVRQRNSYFDNLNADVISDVQAVLHKQNRYVSAFKTAAEILSEQNTDDMNLILSATKRPHGTHERRFNIPCTSELGVLMPNEIFNNRDIILRTRSHGRPLQRINECHRAYDALQYPILFPTGSDGWSIDLKLLNPKTGDHSNKQMSAMQYYTFKLMHRDYFNPLLYSGRLLQQYVVDQFVKMETTRLLYLRLNQSSLRCESYDVLCDTLKNNASSNTVGRNIILPASFTGSPRWYHNKLQDSLAYIRKFGSPDLFITTTMNPQDPVVKNCIYTGQRPEDRPDIVCRVFQRHVQEMKKLMVNHSIFGKLSAWLYSIEYQKRGLPHAHWLLWLSRNDRIHPDSVDNIVCAEIPAKEKDAVLYELVTTCMIHGPCGKQFPNAPCMKDGKCSKGFPKPFCNDTTITDGYPTYKRRSPRDGGNTFVKAVKHKDTFIDYTVDNRWVVPYNPYLIRALGVHSNVEICMSVKAIKYVIKYVHKGNDQSSFAVTESTEARDEISEYQCARYVSASEALWRIFNFPIHNIHPAVTSLP